MSWIDLFLLRLEVAMADAGTTRAQRFRVRESMLRVLS